MFEDRRAWAIGAGTGLLLVVLFVLALPASRQLAVDERLSTYRTTPDGAGAVYETLDRLGIATDRRLTPLVDADSLPAALALLAPTSPLTPRESEALVRWVEEGGQLILVLSWRLTLESMFGLEHDWDDEAVGAAPLEHPWTQGIGELDLYSLTVTDTATGGDVPRRWRPLVEQQPGGAAAVGVLELGRGRVLVIADVGALRNDRVLESGLMPIVARAARDMVGSDDALVFEEFHHGHRGGSIGQALWSLATGTGAGRAGLQALLVGLLALMPFAIRFGSPIHDASPSRRSPLEHVRALGEVYRLSNATGIARRRLIVGFARRIQRERPAAGEEDRFLERLAAQSARGADAVHDLRRQWNRSGDLLTLARQMDKTARELQAHPWTN